jgi:hypothetical protein
LTFVEPQFGIAVVLALLVWVPRTRVVLLAASAMLVIVSISHLGLSQSLEYVTRVLPAQAAGEIPFRLQYGLPWLLYFFGFDETLALRYATIEYAVTLGLGVLVAGFVAKRLDAPEAIAAFPAAAVVVGGPYLHISDIALAVPFAFVLVARAPKLRAVGWCILAIFAVPWQTLEIHSLAVAGATALAIVAFASTAGRPWLLRLTIPAFALALFWAFPGALTGYVPNVGVRPAAAAEPSAADESSGDLAASRRGAAIRRHPEAIAMTWRVFAEKAPLWSGLVILTLGGLLARGARSERPTS